jgi:hypothetical protein
MQSDVLKFKELLSRYHSVERLSYQQLQDTYASLFVPGQSYLGGIPDLNIDLMQTVEYLKDIMEQAGTDNIDGLLEYFNKQHEKHDVWIKELIENFPMEPKPEKNKLIEAAIAPFVRQCREQQIPYAVYFIDYKGNDFYHESQITIKDAAVIMKGLVKQFPMLNFGIIDKLLFDDEL